MVVEEKVGKIRTIHDGGNYTVQSRAIGSGSWDNAKEVNYTSYKIKETDMRIKTASFTSPDYFDLTTGRYYVLISSKYHENFSGVILDVDYDPDTGLYDYQCQDWSRLYIRSRDIVRAGKQNIWNLLVNLLTHSEITYSYKGKAPNSYPWSARKKFQPVLSGLKPIEQYDQSIYEGNKYTGNPFKKKPKFIVRGKSEIEIIRDLVFSQLGFFDVWFNNRGVLQIEPLSKKDWEKTGLHLTTGSALKQKYKFSTTNAMTSVLVQGSGTGFVGTYNSDALLSSRLDLGMFFGMVSTSISDPVQKNKTTTTKTTSKTSTSKTSNVNKDNPYGTKNKEVWITIDTIHGSSTDMKFMKDVAAALNKYGWKCHVYPRVGPSTHYAHAPGYSWSGQVKNGIWFTIYGGACAGTLYEAATANWFKQPLSSRGSRSVVGFLRPPCGDIRKGGKYGSFLPRAHDDNFSPSSFKGISNPAQFLTNKGIPFMYAKNAKEMAEKFVQGGDNPEACNKKWK